MEEVFWEKEFPKSVWKFNMLKGREQESREANVEPGEVCGTLWDSSKALKHKYEQIAED